ncbi:MAG: acyl-CoA dehydrogenase, partial [Microvirga sp.]
RSQTEAMRALAVVTGAALDHMKHNPDEEVRQRSRAFVDLMIPLVKGWSTDTAQNVTYDGVQIHGGMGFIEETGAAQHFRDARIAPIYEGTNGIQAIDLVIRKLPLSGGETVRAQIASMRATVARLLKESTPAFGATAPRLRDAIESLDRATGFLLQAVSSNAQGEALAGATPYLRLFALAQGGAALAEMALAANAQAAAGDADPAHAGRIALCRFFAENIAVGAKGLEDTVMSGAGFLQDATLALAS